MLSIDEFRQTLFEAGSAISQHWPFEIVQIEKAHGRIAYSSIRSSFNVPPKDNSAMDGYAVYCEGVLEPGTVIKISQVIAAGSPPSSLEANTCARIFTGAEIPQGANTVVIQENIEQQGDSIVLQTRVCTGDNIRPAGQDVRKSATVINRGDIIKAPKAGLLASCGINAVKVFERPKVVLITTGDELVMPGETLQPGQIYNSNLFLISNLLQNFGCDIVEQVHLKDSLEASIETLKAASTKAQLIVSCGGVSVGDEDHIKNALQKLGEIQNWKVEMKPGKPLVFGKLLKSTNTYVPFFGLPGNPVSSFVTACLFVRAFLEAAYGREYRLLKGYPLLAGFDLEKEQKRPEFRRCIISDGKITPLQNQSSGALSSVDNCEGLVLIPANKKIKQDQFIEFFPINNLIYM